ncbi:S-adenosylmethionine:tRNA ribosyltransferase-isomerase [Jeotgalibacillus proteolyticus]|uniref:S-adenosylmethionine:tRNA ribosyltransferase-isomerase n=1 Tax=Jeotgalibacillus proteolyticus TaxID=2082395 RepID=A0A2S5GCS8_9BACL|nr:S-adenosylmethionine:tRNA ribosyltransferase-isomerase [Jeotgalibacillus proteolyticus]PPA70806.1 S-adenosylmethionine:tRNA ribosyltransferase-isomerase [Jeotgalibacillus proteolyticus]
MLKGAEKFTIPPHLHASVPLEMLGQTRDSARLLVLNRFTGETDHSRFAQLGDFLSEGDVLVLNNSRTIPAVLKGRQGGNEVEVRLSRKIKEGEWDGLVLNRQLATEVIHFNGDLQAVVVGSGSENPLVRFRFNKKGTDFYNFLYKEAEPVRYEYVKASWPLESYQNVYSSVPGSVEMASAGRAFTWRLLRSLESQGVKLAFIQLHAGLSYYGDDQWPSPKNHPEEFCLPKETVQLIKEAKRNGNRVIAAGTTVVRALETAVTQGGDSQAMRGLTHLHVSKETPLQVADGLLTGFHEPEASHLDMLGAFIDEEVLLRTYKEALEKEYLWHEFGDINLIL